MAQHRGDDASPWESDDVDAVRLSGLMAGFSWQSRKPAWLCVCDVQQARGSGGLAASLPRSSSRESRRAALAALDHQIVVDAERAFHFDVCRRWSADQRDDNVVELAKVLQAVFITRTSAAMTPTTAAAPAPAAPVPAAATATGDDAGSPPAAAALPSPPPPAPRPPLRYHYYQGAHDVASVFLLQLDRAPTTTEALVRLFATSMRGYVRPTLECAMEVLTIIQHLLRLEAPALAKQLEACGLSSPHYALSWVLTWFAHSLSNLSAVARLYDAMLCAHPLFVAHLAVALLVHHGGIVGGLAPDDAGPLFQVLSHLPRRVESELHIGRGLARQPSASGSGTSDDHHGDRHESSLSSLQQNYPHIADALSKHEPLPLSKWIGDAIAMYRRHPALVLLASAPREAVQRLQREWPALFEFHVRYGDVLCPTYASSPQIDALLLRVRGDSALSLARGSAGGQADWRRRVAAWLRGRQADAATDGGQPPQAAAAPADAGGVKPLPAGRYPRRRRGGVPVDDTEPPETATQPKETAAAQNQVTSAAGTCRSLLGKYWFVVATVLVVAGAIGVELYRRRTGAVGGSGGVLGTMLSGAAAPAP